MSFSDDIKSFNDKTERAVESIIRGTALSLFSKIVKRTPVDTGRARGNWQLNVNRKPRSVLGGADKAGGAAIQRANKNLGKAKITDTIWIMNNLPYIEVLEDGSSTQAPSGMVKITVAEYKQIVKSWADEEKI